MRTDAGEWSDYDDYGDNEDFCGNITAEITKMLDPSEWATVMEDVPK